MIERAISSKILSLIKKYPAISVTGPRQSGKTTLLKHLFPDYKYINLEDHVIRSYLQSDARSYLSQFTSGVIIDEAQKYPDLFSYIQIIADEVQKDGMFILSGSQNFILMKSISQSLAGRVSIFHLMPFTKRELEKKEPFQLKELAKPGLLEVDDFNLFSSMFTGFYPRIHDKKLDPQEWLANYFELYVQRDIRDIINIGNISLFINFVKMCAGRVGQLLNLSSLAADCGINHSTAERWISLLETSFIVYRLRPYYKNFSKRIIKSPKLYFYDTGLLCYLLGIKKPEDIRFSPYRGNI
ncbi:MAG: ATP-binding protein, partial [Candidatus Delongbacteria bacterium]|nr:ATP-binding protein [Candidatus Delongbacteria bacterium]